MISFALKEYEISLFHSILWELDYMEDNLISQEIRIIVEKALLSSEISKYGLERLLKLLPQLEIITTKPVNEAANPMDDNYDDWPDWEEVQKAKHKRSLVTIQQHLSNWLFTQYALYQKNIYYKGKLESPMHMKTHKKITKNI